MRFELQNYLRIPLVLLLIGLLIPGIAAAQKIIWVSAGDTDTTGVKWDSLWVDLLEKQGYEVQREDSTMVDPLGDEQIETLESADLIIVGRGCTSGDYDDAVSVEGWNNLTKPILLTTAYFARLSRWQWFNTDALIGDGNSGAPSMKVEVPDHPIFAGVELDENNEVAVLDGSIGSGHTSLMNTLDWGDGELLASTAGTESSWIVYWMEGSTLHGDTDYYAVADRLFFACGTREDTNSPANPTWGWGMYNLTPQGEKIFLNAVAFLLGIVNSTPGAPAAMPTKYQLAQNYPNPFNPSTTISFSVPKAEKVQLQIFNLLGELVVTLTDADFQAGTHNITWNGLDAYGNSVTSGIYLYRLQTKTQTLTKKMIMVQ
jgi:hypothetical protein